MVFMFLRFRYGAEKASYCSGDQSKEEKKDSDEVRRTIKEQGLP